MVQTVQMRRPEQAAAAFQNGSTQQPEVLPPVAAPSSPGGAPTSPGNIGAVKSPPQAAKGCGGMLATLGRGAAQAVGCGEALSPTRPTSARPVRLAGVTDPFPARRLEELDLAVKAQALELQKLRERLRQQSQVIELKSDAVCPQGHLLRPIPHSTVTEDWVCDGKKDPGGCRSLMTDFGQASAMNKFRCETCDYDCCERCHSRRSKAGLLCQKVRDDFESRFGRALPEMASQLQELQEQMDEVLSRSAETQAKVKKVEEVAMTMARQCDLRNLQKHVDALPGILATRVDVHDVQDNVGVIQVALKDLIALSRDQVTAEFQSRLSAVEASFLEKQRQSKDEIHALLQQQDIKDKFYARVEEVQRSVSCLDTKLAQADLTVRTNTDCISQVPKWSDLNELQEQAKANQQNMHHVLQEHSSCMDRAFMQLREEMKADLAVIRSKAEETRSHQQQLQDTVQEHSSCEDRAYLQLREETKADLAVIGSNAEEATRAHQQKLQDAIQEMTLMAKRSEIRDLLTNCIQEQAHRLDSAIAQVRTEAKTDCEALRSQSVELAHSFEIADKSKQSEVSNLLEQLKLAQHQLQVSLSERAEVKTELGMLHNMIQELSLRTAKQSEVSEAQQLAASQQQQVRVEVKELSRHLECSLAKARGEASSDLAAHRMHVDQMKTRIEGQVSALIQKWQEELQRHQRRIESHVAPRADVAQLHVEVAETSRNLAKVSEIELETRVIRSELGTLRSRLELLAQAPKAQRCDDGLSGISARVDLVESKQFNSVVEASEAKATSLLLRQYHADLEHKLTRRLEQVEAVVEDRTTRLTTAGLAGSGSSAALLRAGR